MRRILVDHARARLSLKRGGDLQQQPLGDFPITLPMPQKYLLAVHEVLDACPGDPVKAELGQSSCFGGLSHSEAAETLNLPRSTADRYWSFAKARLTSLMDPK